MPFVLPDSLWNIHRDNLPWTLKLSQFAIDDINQNGSKETLLEPISTNCTLGLNIKSPGFAVCIHADMTPLRASLSDEQLAHTVIFLERVLNFAATIHPQIFIGDNGNNAENDLKHGLVKSNINCPVREFFLIFCHFQFDEIF